MLFVCGFESKDLYYHFVAGCRDKSLFLLDVVPSLSSQELLFSDATIWLAITTSCRVSDLVLMNEDVLIAFGAATSTLWTYHAQLATKMHFNTQILKEMLFFYQLAVNDQSLFRQGQGFVSILSILMLVLIFVNDTVARNLLERKRRMRSKK